MSDTAPSGKPSSSDVSTVESAPRSIGGILLRLGPGLIVAGSIVGSGELIATTKTGAEAGFWLLWLIVIGCVIKVFAQVELGRFSIVTGRTTMAGMNEVPGPAAELSLTGRSDRWKMRGNWLVWYWFLMWLASIGQLGGIVGGVGQALSISIPLTEPGRRFNAFVENKTQRQVKVAELGRAVDLRKRRREAATPQRIAELRAAALELDQRISRDERALVSQLGKSNETGAEEEDADSLARDDLIRELGSSRLLAIGDPEIRRRGGPLEAKGEEGDAARRQVVDRLRALYGDAALAKLGVDEEDQDYDAIVQSLGTARYITLGGGEAGVEPQIAAGWRNYVDLGEKPATPPDEFLWAGIIGVLTSIVLMVGRYGLIQHFSTVMVASFTAITVINVVMLQTNDAWSIGWGDLWAGLSFRLPPASAGAEGAGGVATALATFGIIGVGASELITYPYWCLEKGYARFTGPRDKTEAWAERARGWMRVMRWDAWCSMVVYTFATVAFYLLGAAVLGRVGLNPGGNELIRTLAVMYEPVFQDVPYLGNVAPLLFLFGAFAVLYSTYFVANASHARVFSDALRELGLISRGEKTRRRWVRALSGIFPLLCVAIYVLIPSPAALVLLSGLMQALMLPMLAGAALYFRYFRSDERIRPTKVWDVFLWVSAAGMLIAGVWAAWSNLLK